MACRNCPYQENYRLIWERSGATDLRCVMLHCCAGPELQLRAGGKVILDELHPTEQSVYQRAEVLRNLYASAGVPAAQ